MEEERRRQLLKLARESIRTAFSGEQPEIPASSEEYGAFVTLKKDGQLRGCIGYLLPIAPLDEQIARLARSAAFDDYRFPRLKEDELASCTIEISLLSLPLKIPSVDAFQLGKHGIYLTVNGHRAVFLPQVAEETGWTKEELLAALSRKAGLPADAWKSPNALFEVFTAEVFSE
ncbi:MAG: AmmeMemoRadiSam system protein A [Sphaerochaetaceae bacterium]|jgi:AmmeMemoRadiSam system protein A